MKRNLSRLLVLVLSLSLLLGGSALAAYTLGSYTGTGTGMNGDVTVEVVFGEEAIESVTVTEHNETQGISDPAIERIPAAIVEANSTEVDAVAGATLTSNAIIEAVNSCIAQALGEAPAGGDKPQVEWTGTQTADVVVVGGGIAGLSAAIEAADAGASVILLEKMEKTGGASALSGGECLAAGTQLQADNGIEDSWEALADYWVEKGEGEINEEMVRAIAEMAPQNILWMQENGVEFMPELQTPTSMPWQDPKRNHKTANGTGTGFTEPLTASAEAKGVTIITGTPATSLVVEDGVVKGVECEDLTVLAKNVILATGGYENNTDLMGEYSPTIGDLPSHIGDAHLGEAIMWAEELGSPIIAGDGGIVLSINYFTFISEDLDPYGAFMYVDATGKRFMNEADYWFHRSRLMLDLPGAMSFTILDAKAAELGAQPEAAVEAGAGLKADTIEELEKLMNVYPGALQETIDTYNAAAAAGKDEEFGKDASKLTPIDTPPFYALYNTLNTNTGSFGGPQIDNTCKVLDADGNPIPGLYAAGECANGEIFYREYPCSGSAIQSYMSMGRIAGKDAAQ